MSKAKSDAPSKDFSPRLLLQNFDGHQTAVPLNDSLRMVAGVDTWPLKMMGEIHKAQAALRNDAGATTIFAPGGGGGPFVVTLGIKEIFQRVANARDAGGLVIDLVKESGYAALETKARQTSAKAKTAGGKISCKQSGADGLTSGSRGYRGRLPTGNLN